MAVQTLTCDILEDSDEHQVNYTIFYGVLQALDTSMLHICNVHVCMCVKC